MGRERQPALNGLLLDTHALYWWLTEHPKLAPEAYAAIASEQTNVYVSAISAYEIAFKNRLGKLEVPETLLDTFPDTLAIHGFREISLSVRHAIVAAGLDFPHRDPFDRMLIAQALEDGLTLVSNERGFDATGVARLWD